MEKIPAVLTLSEDNGAWSTDTAEFTFRDGHLNVTVEEPWAGDTETGFGQSSSVGLTVEAASKLHEWLGLHLAALTARGAQ